MRLRIGLAVAVAVAVDLDVGAAAKVSAPVLAPDDLSAISSFLATYCPFGVSAYNWAGPGMAERVRARRGVARRVNSRHPVAPTDSFPPR